MSFTIKGINRTTGAPIGFTFNGKSFTTLNSAELQVAISEVLSENIQLKNRRELDKILTIERLTGLDSKVKGIRFNKFMEQLKS